MTRTIRIAAVQMRSGTRPGPNLDALEGFVAEAVAVGARYVLTPEMTVAFAENREGLAGVAGPSQGNEDIAALSQMAARNGIYLHVGSLAVALPDGYFANRSVLFGPDGAMIGQYDKIHLFDAVLPGLNAYRESATYRSGAAAVTADIDGFKLGFAICYDVRFPALFSALANDGAELLALPAAFTVPTGEAHWETLLRARAIETGCFVIAAAQGGSHENGRATYGHSMIIDPWGRIVAEAEGDAPGVIFADIDFDAIAEARGRVPALANARAFSFMR